MTPLERYSYLRDRAMARLGTLRDQLTEATAEWHKWNDKLVAEELAQRKAGGKL